MKPLTMLVVVTVAVSLFGAGCRRKPSTQTPAADKAPAPATLPDAPAGAGAGQQTPAVDLLPTAPKDSSIHFPVQKEITGAIHLYSMDNHKLPADFQTLVTEKYLPALPKPPPGKRFALDRNRMQVVVID